jgi:polyhydroxyalkanoate synthesis regulator phasin
MPPKIPKLNNMTPSPDWKRALSAGIEFTEMRRSQARSLVGDLVAQGHLARDQMSAAVDEVLEVSRRRSDELRKVVQNEVQRQLGALGLATKADLRALERRVGSGGGAAGTATKKSAAAKKSPSKKPPAKKVAAKKPAAKRAPSRKSTAQPVTKAAATKAAPKKASATSAPKAG